MFQSGVSTKRKFITEALFKAELHEILKRELSGEDGFSEIDIRTHPTHYQIFIHATKPKQVRGENGRRIRELTSVVSKRFNLPSGKLVLLASEVPERGLCAVTQAESLRYKLLEGVAVRRACYGVIRFVIDSGARGVEVIVSGKLRNQRAKSMKFHDGLMIHSGHPVNEFVRSAVRHVQLRQGMLGIKVKIMLPEGYTVKGKTQKPLPDQITIMQPKEEPEITAPYSVSKEEEQPASTVAGISGPPASSDVQYQARPMPNVPPTQPFSSPPDGQQQFGAASYSPQQQPSYSTSSQNITSPYGQPQQQQDVQQRVEFQPRQRQDSQQEQPFSFPLEQRLPGDFSPERRLPQEFSSQQPQEFSSEQRQPQRPHVEDQQRFAPQQMQYAGQQTSLPSVQQQRHFVPQLQEPAYAGSQPMSYQPPTDQYRHGQQQYRQPSPQQQYRHQGPSREFQPSAQSPEYFDQQSGRQYGLPRQQMQFPQGRSQGQFRQPRPEQEPPSSQQGPYGDRRQFQQ